MPVSIPAMTALTDVPSVATRFRYAVYLKARELLADEVKDDESRNEAFIAFQNYMATTPNDRALKQREKHYTGVSIPRDFP